MTELSWLGRLLILFGLVIAAVGVIILLAGRVPWLGRLPGDILVRREGFAIYFPIATALILSIILTLIFSLFSRRLP